MTCSAQYSRSWAAWRKTADQGRAASHTVGGACGVRAALAASITGGNTGGAFGYANQNVVGGAKFFDLGGTKIQFIHGIAQILDFDRRVEVEFEKGATCKVDPRVDTIDAY